MLRLMQFFACLEAPLRPQLILISLKPFETFFIKFKTYFLSLIIQSQVEFAVRIIQNAFLYIYHLFWHKIKIA